MKEYAALISAYMKRNITNNITNNNQNNVANQLNNHIGNASTIGRIVYIPFGLIVFLSRSVLLLLVFVIIFFSLLVTSNKTQLYRSLFQTFAPI